MVQQLWSIWSPAWPVTGIVLGQIVTSFHIQSWDSSLSVGRLRHRGHLADQALVSVRVQEAGSLEDGAAHSQWPQLIKLCLRPRQEITPSCSVQRVLGVHPLEVSSECPWRAWLCMVPSHGLVLNSTGQVHGAEAISSPLRPVLVSSHCATVFPASTADLCKHAHTCVHTHMHAHAESEGL